MPWIVLSCLSDAATCFRLEGRRNERGTNGPNFLSFLCLKAAPCEVHVWHSLPLIAKLASHFLPPRARSFVFPPPGFFRRSICAKNDEFSSLRAMSKRYSHLITVRRSKPPLMWLAYYRRKGKEMQDANLRHGSELGFPCSSRDNFSSASG